LPSCENRNKAVWQQSWQQFAKFAVTLTDTLSGYALELETASTHQEAERIVNEMLHSEAARQLSYDGLKALMAIARRRSERFSDD
jgi:hypothetical protein